jgi:transcriptional regulator with XRE-family HTH domain
MLDSTVPKREAVKGPKAPREPKPAIVPLTDLLRNLRESKIEFPTPAEFAREMGVNQGRITEIESGCYDLKILTLRAFTKALNAPLWQVIQAWELREESSMASFEEEIRLVMAYRETSPERRGVVRDVLGLTRNAPKKGEQKREKTRRRTRAG